MRGTRVRVVVFILVGAACVLWTHQWATRDLTLSAVPGWALNGSGDKTKIYSFDELIPQRGLAIVNTAASVDVFKLVGPSGGMGWDFDGQTLGRRESPKPDAARRLAATLTSPATYHFPTGRKHCG